MPEGPEIRREADALARALAGRELAHVEYRIAALAARGRRLRGARVLRVYPRGKALLIEFDRGVTHYSHNQLYGQWRVLAAGQRRRRLARGPRRARHGGAHGGPLQSRPRSSCSTSGAVARHPYIAKLGPDVLDPATTVRAIAARIEDPRFARSSLAALLLDQRFHRGTGQLPAQRDPARRPPAGARCGPATSTTTQRAALARAIHALPRQSYRTRGITSDLRGRARCAGRGLAFEDYRFRVYGRAGLPCRACGAPIARREAAGRGLFACPAAKADWLRRL